MTPVRPRPVSSILWHALNLASSASFRRFGHVRHLELEWRLGRAAAARERGEEEGGSLAPRLAVIKSDGDKIRRR